MQSSLSSVRLLRRAQNIRSWCHLKTLAQTRSRSSVWRPLVAPPGVRYLSLGCARFNTTGLNQEELSLLGLESSSASAALDVNPLADISEAKLSSSCDVSSSVDGAGATAQDADVLTDGAGVDGGQVAGGYVSPFEATGDFSQVTNALAEPTFHSMGLAHWWPSGCVQSLMEVIHIDLDLPWWQTIGLTTICLRIVVFPIMVIAQKNMVKMNNHQPEIQKLQIQSQLAGIRGNLEEQRFANGALNNYFHANGCHPAKAMWPIFAQAYFFMSMFFGLRGMTNVPVPSLSTGGLAWFTDLSVSDPTLVLPLATAATIYFQLYLGADGMKADTFPPFLRKVLYVMPLISIPVMVQFPAALNLYWLSNNVISVFMAKFLRTPAVRDKLGFEEQIVWKPEDLPMTNFQEEMKMEMARQGKLRKEEATRKRLSEERMKEKRNEREFGKVFQQKKNEKREQEDIKRIEEK